MSVPDEQQTTRRLNQAMGLTALCLIAWPLLRRRVVTTLHAWVVPIDIVLLLVALTVGRRASLRWKSGAARVAFSLAMVWMALVVVKEAANIFIFLILTGTQPGSPR